MFRLWHLGIFVVVPFVLLAAWLLARPAPNLSGSIYGYDLGSGKLFATNDGIPPFEAPTGFDAGVLAHAVLFDGEEQPTVVYLTTFTPRAHEQARTPGGNAEEIAAGMLVRRPEDSKWIQVHTPEGQAIRQRITELAAGREWRLALP